MTIKHLFPVAKPTLDLNFAAERTLGPRITFTRSSIGTYMDAAGILRYAAEDEPRFDYSSTGESLGLLIEEARVNVVKANTTGSDAGWEYGEESTEVQPPTGGTNSVRKGGSLKLKNNNLTAPSETYQAWITMFVNTASWSRFAFRTITGSTNYFFFDLSGPTPRIEEKQGNNIITDVNPQRYICEQLANGWWRIGYRNWNSIDFGYRQLWRFDWDENDEPIIINNFPAGAPANTFIYAWGGQMEIGANASSFIPNTGTNSITRAADICSIEGDNFSSWYNQSEGTILVDVSYLGLPDNTTLQNSFSFQTSNSGPRTTLTAYGANSRMRVRADTDGNVYPGDTFSVTKPRKCAVGYKINDLNFTFNGSRLGTDTSYTPTTSLNRLVLDTGYGGSPSSKRIARLSYYPRRLSDEQLQALTA